MGVPYAYGSAYGNPIEVYSYGRLEHYVNRHAIHDGIPIHDSYTSFPDLRSSKNSARNDRHPSYPFVLQVVILTRLSMASKMPDNGGVDRSIEDWQQIKEEITCSICGDLFTDPKTIPCLHTFCKRCIERSIESNKKMAVIVCCPLCRVPLPRDEMASIPTNFTINRLIEIFGKRQKAEASVEMKCASCEENFAAITWCIQCEDPLCHNCNEIHKKMKMSRSHKTIPIKQYFQSSKQALATLEKTELCKFHQSQPLDLYCKTCSSLISLAAPDPQKKGLVKLCRKNFRSGILIG